MPGSLDRLIALLPDIFAIRDAEVRGDVVPEATARQRLGPLASLLDLLAEQGTFVEEDIAALYDDWFIETAAPWVVPYIGDLLGVRGLRDESGRVSSRAFVANTMHLRRGKGTARVLGELAADASGFPAVGREYFALLGATQHLDHVRRENVRTPDLRDANRLELLSGPFTNAARAAEVRRITSARGRFNIPSVGLHLWTLDVLPYQQVRARPANDAGADPATCFRFNPLGLDAPLFNVPAPGATPGNEASVPGPLRRRPLFDELQALRAGSGRDALTWFATGLEPFAVAVQQAAGAPAEPLDPADLGICNLEAWGQIPNGILAAVDPVRGRVRFAQPPAGPVFADAAFALAGHSGGGPYDREPMLLGPASEGEVRLPDNVTFLRVVNSTPRPAAPGVPPQLGRTPDVVTAVQQWNDAGGADDGVILIENSDTYAAPPAIVLAGGGHLAIIAARWRGDAAPPQASLAPLAAELQENLSPDGVRPHILGGLTVTRPAPGAPAAFGLSGVAVEGAIAVSGNLAQCRFADCTIPPGFAVTVDAGGAEAMRLSFARCLLGGLTVTGSPEEAFLRDSAFDGALDALTSRVDLERSTMRGAVTVQEIHASDCIFVEPLAAARLQQGCVRFSFLPEDSRAPRRYRCQPQTARDAAPPGEGDRAAHAVTPSFTSTSAGHPGYLQLAATVPAAIAAGASDGGEMGVFNASGRTQRIDNLRAVLPEYLRAGLEAGVFMTT